ncbi:hypothetical protein EV356DRAFT_531871 [Viridothelium virens]|uniref:Uncharacterized protein n=1 Tax=Viridothelium virens TaxID=1048519 RepID=A0A6A6HC71_VIRVR|nr:hypothetical protein EV356DRAFT_531871 [Viridothelium virens]
MLSPVSLSFPQFNFPPSPRTSSERDEPIRRPIQASPPNGRDNAHLWVRRSKSMENGWAASPESDGGEDNEIHPGLKRTNSSSPSADARSIRSNNSERRRTISGTLLARLPFIRSQNGTGRLASQSEEALQISAVDNAIDDDPRGSNAMARALKAQKYRRRKGSLRKTAMLATGSLLRMERRGSSSQRTSSTRSQRDAILSPEKSEERSVGGVDGDSIRRRRFSYERQEDALSFESLYDSPQSYSSYSAKPAAPFPLDPALTLTSNTNGILDPRPKLPPTPPLLPARRPTYPSSPSTTSFESSQYDRTRRESYPSTTTSEDDNYRRDPSGPISRTTTAESLEPRSSEDSYFPRSSIDTIDDISSNSGGGGGISSLKPSSSVRTIRSNTPSASTSTTSLLPPPSIEPPRLLHPTIHPPSSSSTHHYRNHHLLRHPSPQPQPHLRRRTSPSPLSYSPYQTSTPLPSPTTSSSSSLSSAATTVSYGVLILVATWLVFIVGMGSCLGIWSWAWDVGETPYAPPELEDDPTLPVVGYYPALLVLTGVVAWGWVTVAWVGMKYFRHAKVVGDE